MDPYEFNSASSASEIGKIASEFGELHGDPPYGTIPDEEFDKLYDNLVAILAQHGRFEEGWSNPRPDFSGSRYCDQTPSIGIVPRKDLNPAIALHAGLEAVASSHRPLGIIFDFYPNSLFVCSPNRVFSTFDQSTLIPTSDH
jgi:hypothetical protein